MRGFNPLNPVLNYAIEHSALGFGFLLAFHFLLPPSWFWWAMLALEVVLVLKETLFDPNTEGKTQPFLWAGVTDLSFYQVGFAVAGILVAIHGHVLML